MTRLFAGTPFDIPPRCEHCNELLSECRCTDSEKDEFERQRKIDVARLPASEQIARVTLQKRKGNRKVTVVEGLTAAASDLPDLLAKLQSVCGAGGTVKAKEDILELQGDHFDKVANRLRELGYRVRTK